MPKQKFECPVCHETLELTGKNKGAILRARDLWMTGHKHLELAPTLPKPAEDTPVTELPAQYMDAEGRIWVLCGCGHYAGGSIYHYNGRVDYCPNCDFAARFSGNVKILRPDRLTEDTARRAGVPLAG